MQFEECNALPAKWATVLTEQEKEDHLFVSIKAAAARNSSLYLTVIESEFCTLQQKVNPNKLRNWREAMQVMVLELFSFQELIVSCPTEKGQKSSSMDRKALDPVRLRTVYGELCSTN